MSASIQSPARRTSTIGRKSVFVGITGKGPAKTTTLTGLTDPKRAKTKLTNTIYRQNNANKKKTSTNTELASMMPRKSGSSNLGIRVKQFSELNVKANSKDKERKSSVRIQKPSL